MSREIKETNYKGVYRCVGFDIEGLLYSTHTDTLITEDEYFNKYELNKNKYKATYDEVRKLLKEIDYE